MPALEYVKISLKLINFLGTVYENKAVLFREHVIFLVLET